MHISDEDLMRTLIGVRQKNISLDLNACFVQEGETRYDLTELQMKKLQLLGECHRRILQAKVSHQPVHNPEAVVTIMRPLVLGRETEGFWVLPLNAHRALLCAPVQISSGDVDGTDAGPRGILRAVLKRNSVAAIVVHNHPSGEVTPSPSDIAVTKRLVEAGKLVDISIDDHVVVTSSGAYSSIRGTHPQVFM